MVRPYIRKLCIRDRPTNHSI